MVILTLEHVRPLLGEEFQPLQVEILGGIVQHGVEDSVHIQVHCLS